MKKKIEQLDRKRPAVMPEIIAEFKTMWFLVVDGTDYSELIPDRDSLHGVYTKGFVEDWAFDGDDEEFVEIDEGLDQDEWIEDNLEWLSKISTNIRVLRRIYDAFQEAEWGENAC